jgi:hypothetical protein
MNAFRLSLSVTIAACGAAMIAACAFFTPARIHELGDIACVIVHYELPDTQLAPLCGFAVEDMPTVRAQARAAAAAGVEREKRDAGIP